MQNENAGGGVDLYRHAVPGKWVDSGKKVLFFFVEYKCYRLLCTIPTIVKVYAFGKLGRERVCGGFDGKKRNG